MTTSWTLFVGQTTYDTAGKPTGGIWVKHGKVTSESFPEEEVKELAVILGNAGAMAKAPDGREFKAMRHYVSRLTPSSAVSTAVPSAAEGET